MYWSLWTDAQFVKGVSANVHVDFSTAVILICNGNDPSKTPEVTAVTLCNRHYIKPWLEYITGQWIEINLGLF